MISFFRRLFSSKIGLALMMGFLGLIAFAFVAADLGNVALGGGTAGASGGPVATVGGQPISAAELEERVRREYDSARQQQPELTFETYLAQGAVERVADRMIVSYALDAFARAQGMTVSSAMEVAQIQNLPAFRGLDGNFDRSLFDQTLRSINLSEEAFRADLGRELLANQLLIPVSGAARAPAAIVRAQADLLLEARAGSAVTVPVAGIAVPTATEAEIAAEYRRNVQRYTIPERRVARYALVDAATLPLPTPSEAEIAAAYRENQARYAATETRTLTQVILPDEEAARRVAAAVAGGQPIAAAAAAAGLEPTTLADQTRAAFAGLSSDAVAAAAFGAAEGALAAPARSGLGWHVVRVDAIATSAGRSFDSVRDALAAELTATRRQTALADAVARIQDLVAEGATFAEAAGAVGVAVATTPPLLADGRQAGAAGPPPPLAVQLAQATFGSEPGDDPVIQEIVADQSYALVDIAQLVPAAAPPLTQIAPRVAADLQRARALAEARRVAQGIASRATGPTSLADAARAADRAVGAPRAVSAVRQELGAGGAATEAAALFSLRPGEARAFQAADGSGWIVVHLDQVTPGNAAGRPDLLQATAVALGQAFATEYVEQFLAAARGVVGVTRDDAAIAAVRASLAGTR